MTLLGAAEIKAKEIWALSENPTEDFAGSGNGVEVIEIEEITGTITVTV